MNSFEVLLFCLRFLVPQNGPKISFALLFWRLNLKWTLKLLCWHANIEAMTAW